VERSGRDVIELLSRHLLGSNEENHASVRTSRIQVCSGTVALTYPFHCNNQILACSDLIYDYLRPVFTLISFHIFCKPQLVSWCKFYPFLGDVLYIYFYFTLFLWLNKKISTSVPVSSFLILYLLLQPFTDLTNSISVTCNLAQNLIFTVQDPLSYNNIGNATTFCNFLRFFPRLLCWRPLRWLSEVLAAGLSGWSVKLVTFI
jgi:hypothetical protein